MAEIADMMIEGDLCECCGSALDDPGEGFPKYCSVECAKDRGIPKKDWPIFVDGYRR